MIITIKILICKNKNNNNNKNLKSNNKFLQKIIFREECLQGFGYKSLIKIRDLNCNIFFFVFLNFKSFKFIKIEIKMILKMEINDFND